VRAPDWVAIDLAFCTGEKFGSAALPNRDRENVGAFAHFSRLLTESALLNLLTFLCVDLQDS